MQAIRFINPETEHTVILPITSIESIVYGPCEIVITTINKALFIVETFEESSFGVFVMDMKKEKEGI